MSEPITIRKKNPLRKAEIPVIGIALFYLFIFYAMADGDLGLMFSKLFSTENGIIGLTFAVMGFGITIFLGLLQVSKISITDKDLIASSRIGLKKRYPLGSLEACRIKWYREKGRRFPFFQWNFKDGRKLQIVGHHYKGLKPLILHLRSGFGEKLIEMK